MKELYMKRKDIDYWMPIALESLGNKTLLSMLPGLLQVVEKGGMFIVDEFSSACKDWIKSAQELKLKVSEPQYQQDKIKDIR